MVRYSRLVFLPYCTIDIVHFNTNVMDTTAYIFFQKSPDRRLFAQWQKQLNFSIFQVHKNDSDSVFRKVFWFAEMNANKKLYFTQVEIFFTPMIVQNVFVKNFFRFNRLAALLIFKSNLRNLIDLLPDFCSEHVPVKSNRFFQVYKFRVEKQL